MPKQHNAVRLYGGLPEEGLVRLPQIIGDRKRGITGVFPISRSSWYAGIKAGLYPEPVKLGPRTAAWEVGKIRKLLEQQTAN